MLTRKEISSKISEIRKIEQKLGICSIVPYISAGGEGDSVLFVVDLDTAVMDGYAGRYFQVMFALQALFARPVEIVEADMFKSTEYMTRYVPLKGSFDVAA